ncbi:MAG: DUF177 domain-containing protein [Lentisphaerae bacterium]|nr:DUF177 domain-containing protein [Lentisphaerota bacterium]
MIFFSVSALEKAPVSKSGVLPPEFLDLAGDDQYSAAGEGSYDLTAQLISGGVLVSGRVSIPVSSICGRCLQPVDFTLDPGEVKLFFEVDENQELLDIDEDVRAELLLELPMNPLCSPDCPGLCPECGCDLNSQQCNCRPADNSGKVSPWSALDSLDL